MNVRLPSAQPLGRLLEELPAARVHNRRDNLPVLAIAEHTDRVGAGTLFACVPGRRLDGHRFAAAAVDRGAAGLVVSRYLPELAGTPQVEVDDVRAAAARLARRLHGRPDQRLLVLAVTGTNGKTTTTFLLESIFAAAGRPLARVGTVGCRVGAHQLPSELTTPVSGELHAILAEAVAQGLAGVALEASSHALDQARLTGVEVDTAVFTGFSRDHLDYHGDPMAYFAAKRRLFEPRPGGKPFPQLGVVCVDQPAGRLLARRLPPSRRPVTFGLAPDALVRGHLAAEGRLRIASPWGSGVLALPLPGRHNARNALGAAAAALANGVPLAAVSAGIADLPGVPGRFEHVRAGQPFSVVVDFAHNPDGLANALRSARSCCPGRLLLVFGCKGGDSDQGKRRRMGAIAARLADACFITADDPYDEDPAAIAAVVADGAVEAAPGAAISVEADRVTAITAAIEMAQPGDLVLVAGRGHERWQTVRGRRLPLCDRDVCLRALAGLRTAVLV